jgi:uncharacterized membrane protein
MKRQNSIARPAHTDTRQAVLVFTTAVLAILVAGPGFGSRSNGTATAFSPIISPRAATARTTTMMTTTNTMHDLVSSSTEHHFQRMVPLSATSKPESLEPEHEQEKKKSTNPTQPAPVESTMKDAQTKDNDDSSSTCLIATKDNHNTTEIGYALKSLQPAMAACFALALAFLPLQDANAAMSGGRMGGSFSASPSRLAPVIRPSSRGFSPGFASSRSTVVNVSPSFRYGYGGYGYSTPFFAPRPYYGGGSLAISRGPGLFELLFLGVFLVKAAEVLSETTSVIGTKVDSLGYNMYSNTPDLDNALGPGTSVVQLSVAMQVSDRDDPRKSILVALDNLAKTSKTDSRVGIQNLSSQVALEILRRSSSIVSASSSTKHFSSRDKALREFQSRSIDERSKFETETMSKFGGVDYNKNRNGVSNHKNSDKATMVVVTLVLAIDGDSTVLNKINRASDVKQSLQKIAVDSKVGDCLQSAEILWTPEDRSESLSIRDVVADYPELRSI